MDDLIKSLIKAGAPVLGTVIGGPVGTLAGAAIGALADALGTPATPEAVKTAIETRPDAKAIVQAVEAAKGPTLNADLDAILRDRQDARATTVKLVESGSAISWGAPVVSVIVMIGFAILSYLAIYAPASQREVLLFLLGNWSIMAGAVVSFWLGSSSSSKGKDETIRQMASAPSPKVK